MHGRLTLMGGREWRNRGWKEEDMGYKEGDRVWREEDIL